MIVASWGCGLRAAGMEETPLHYFVIENYSEAVNVLLQAGADVNATNASLQTALMNAASLNLDKMIRKLVAHGADIHARDENGDMALHLAVELGCMRAAQALIELGASVTEKNGMGDALCDIVPAKHQAKLLQLLEDQA